MKRVTFAAGAALIGVGVINPAHAAGEWYVFGQAGINHIATHDARTITATTGDVTNFRIDPEDGFAAGLAVGYAVNDHWRVEGEYTYRKNGAGRSSGRTFAGDFINYSFMANLIYNISPTTQFTPYVGIGGGAVIATYDDYRNANFAATPGGTIDDSDLVLAAQLIGGVDYKVSETISLGIRYTLQKTDDSTVMVQNESTTLKEGSHLNHTFSVGVSYRF